MTLLLVGFVGGLLAAISPCVLPVLPIVLLGGATGTQPDAERSWARPVAIVAGLTLSFTLFTLFGALLLRLLHLPPGLLHWLGIGTLVVLGLAMLIPGIGHLLERPFALIPQRTVDDPGRGVAGGFVLGLALGAVYVPCAGPVLAAIAIAGAAGEIGGGTIALTLGFAAGTALPLLVIALAGNRLSARVRFLSDRARTVRVVAGIAMIVLAVALSANLTDVIARKVPDYTKTIGAALPEAVTPSAVLAAPRAAGNGSLQNCQDDAYRGTSTLSDCGPAPELTGLTQWLGSEPLTLAGLRGKVVLIDFWAYSCINCQRELPHVEAWYRAYGPLGFQVIGVHTPEYAFERVPDNISAGAARLGLTFPIAVDNDYKTWMAYQNIAWPAGYLIDATGVIRRVNFGEGEYPETEANIRSLLVAAQPGLTLPPPIDVVDIAPHDRKQTPELRLGATREPAFAGGTLQPGTHSFAAPNPVPPNTFALTGNWTVGDDELTAGDGASIALTYHAAKVYLNVAGTGTLTVDGGRTLPVKGEPNIYAVVDGDTAADGTITIAVTPGLAVYSFTFG